MDQKKQGQQSEGFKGQQQPQHQSSQQKSSQQQDSQPHQNWQEPQTQNPNREPAEGPRQIPSSQEKGRGQGGGITNRDLDREMDEQNELPDRGTSRDESER